jgi:DNA polymerase-3 subunit alpha
MAPRASAERPGTGIFGQPSRRRGYNIAHVRSPLRPSPRSLRILDCRRHRASRRHRQGRAADGQGALALTDLGNAFGLVRFYQEARGKGIKPIAGCDVWITNPDDRDKPSRLLLLVKDKTGYLNLCELLSKAWLTNQYRGRAELDASWLDGELSQGLLALSGAQQGDIGLALAAGNEEAARRHAQRWAEVFPGGFYIELQRYGQPGAEAYIQQAATLAASLQLPVVATHPMQFMTEDDFTAHEARVYRRRRHARESAAPEALHDRSVLPHAGRHGRAVRGYSVGGREHGGNREALQPEARARQAEAAAVPDAGRHVARRLPGPAVEGGLEKRLEQLYPDAAERERSATPTTSGSNSRPGPSSKMGFPGYFLIVADFINWAKNNGVPVGPGRGSGAGSLVAYALGITDLDPLRYNLLFERFLNPERVSMPDFDIDFCQHGRDRVIQYVKEKYGADAVSQIATFGTMAKAAVRDVGRVLDLGYMFTDGVAKLIPFKPGKHVTLADAMKEEPQLQERYDNEDEVHQLLDLAQRVEGLTRNVGMHAGGVLIAPGKLTDFCPLYTQGDDAGVVSQYDKDDVEAVGLVKFDFLGLTTLTILDWAERYIRRLDPTKADWSLARCRSTTGVVRAPQESQHGRGVPAGKPRHAGHAEGRAARPLRRHHRARGAVPSGPDGPDPELLRPQARAREGRLSGSARRTRPERDLRHHGLSGAGDADGADHRRLLARRRRLAARAMGKKKPEEMAKHREIFAKVRRRTASRARRPTRSST